MDHENTGLLTDVVFGNNETSTSFQEMASTRFQERPPNRRELALGHQGTSEYAKQKLRGSSTSRVVGTAVNQRRKWPVGLTR